METTIDPDAHYTQVAMRALSRFVPSSLDDAPDAVRARFNNALLNVAVNRLIEVEGRTAAATILWRIVDALQDGYLANPGTPHRPHAARRRTGAVTRGRLG